ncbi:CHAD domain-containing protein [Lysobacter sp. TY2-98]|uniref:CHAD domain-containing protein n=1 Tax=Lysobacter sp. TY2-98 TaxID=2290922 RepID=UPI000E200AEA|nr:CHAD domain-containing protein [Lysobacter sp. TY2-98]AXK72836.1 CHAD domain-containing protein [Lysobacter sp. TY2-98]
MSAHDDPVGKRFQRYVSDQLCFALPALELASRESRRGIHQGRKAVRRARAALLLCWRRPTPSVAIALDQLKRANDQLSDLRDANAQVGALKTLARGASGKARHALKIARRSMKRTRARLECDARSIARVVAARERVAFVSAGIAALPWNDVVDADIQAALTATRGQVADARRAALADPSPKKLHTWRRRLRRLLQQYDACIALGIPVPAETLSECVAEQLGRIQDENVLMASAPQLTGLRGSERRRFRRAVRKARNEHRKRLLSVVRFIG